MRVIAGNLKGRRLLCPSGTTVRPTADATKETIFNLLGARLPGSIALDVFAGIGALGIEALSRGARRVDFIERDGSALKYLCKNLERIGIGEEAGVLKGDAFTWIRKLHAKGRTYGVAFVDPPYGMGMVARFLSCEEAHPVLGEGGTLVVQHHAKEQVERHPSRYAIESQRTFGDTIVTLLVSR